MLAHWCQRTYRWASSAGLRAYSRNASSVHYSRGGCSDVRRSSDMRILMLADVVVVAITLLITVRFFVRYRRGR